MKVKTLIEKLKEFNQEADITLTTSEDICLSYICKNPDTGEKLTKTNTKQVFIEPTDECPSCFHECISEGKLWCSFYEKWCREVEECYQYLPMGEE